MNPRSEELREPRTECRDQFHGSHSSKQRLILFTRYPIAGKAKTRLIPVLGAQGAARLQRRLTLRAVRSAAMLRNQGNEEVGFEIHFDGADETAMSHWLGDGFGFHRQAEGDLGRRMCCAFEKSFCSGAKAAVIIGSDCPQLTTEILAEAFERLRENPVVLGPAKDGGYYLIGLRRAVPELFSGLAWGSSAVLATSLQVLQKLGLKPALLQPLDDIDRPEDLAVWRHLVETEEGDLSRISIIIPALNEADNVGTAVKSAAQGKPLEIIVVDGGSRDQTVEKAREAGAAVLVSQPGRARQMNAGAASATGNVLLFLHADTLLPADYAGVIAGRLSEPGIAAGAFRFAVAQPFQGSKWVERTTNLRSRWLQMPYGDQALFLRRALFEELGGFANMPILEDYELMRRLRQSGKVVTLSEPAITSARRWRRLGFWRTTLINSWMILGYRLGRPIEKLAASYHCQKKAETLKR